MTPALKETLAQNAERAALELAEAEKTHKDAVDRAESIKARIEAVRSRKGEITGKRLDGSSTDVETAELAALILDEEALAIILAKAQSDAAALTPDAARNRLATAEAEWEKHTAEVRLDAVRERAKQLEAVLVDALAELAFQAKAAGAAHFREVWTPSPELETVMGHSRLETVSSIRRAS